MIRVIFRVNIRARLHIELGLVLTLQLGLRSDFWIRVLDYHS